jgi:hypothetical protein
MTEDLEQKHKDEIEGLKLFYDTFKHLTTLSTASLLLLATLLEKFFKAPLWTILIGVTFFALIVSLVAALSAMLAYGSLIHSSEDQDARYMKVLGIGGIVGALGGYLVGIIALVAFTLKNFYQ